jgi:sec-independent protein translocase protein TatB
MLDFGFSEILLTSVIALVVLGPERLPKVARQVGNWVGRARAMARQLSEQLDREVSAEELLKQSQRIHPPPAAPVSSVPVSPAPPPASAAPLEPPPQAGLAPPVTPHPSTAESSKPPNE